MQARRFGEHTSSRMHERADATNGNKTRICEFAYRYIVHVQAHSREIQNILAFDDLQTYELRVFLTGLCVLANALLFILYCM